MVGLLMWFKEEFFTWVDKPECDYCGGETHYLNTSTDGTMDEYTKRVEVLLINQKSYTSKLYFYIIMRIYTFFPAVYVHPMCLHDQVSKI